MAGHWRAANDVGDNKRPGKMPGLSVSIRQKDQTE